MESRISRRRQAVRGLIFLIGLGAVLTGVQASQGQTDGLAPLPELATLLPEIDTGGARSLKPFYSITGHVSYSVDAAGSNGPMHYVDVYKPNAGATVLRAYLIAATIPAGGVIPTGGVRLNGQVVIWERTEEGIYSISNQRANVTSIVKPVVDAAAAGNVPFQLWEANVGKIDGEILAVVLEDPAVGDYRTVVLLWGSQNPTGDTFSITTSEPIDPAAPGAIAAMGLGISWSTGGVQHSEVSVLDQRITSSAGGYDDGSNANGAYLTCGGLGDSLANPPDPYAQGPSSYDDELYSLLPFLNASLTQFDVVTLNPSNDDNIFFAHFYFSAAAIVAQRAMLQPLTAEREIGAQHALTATVADYYGTPIPNLTVTFRVIAGPNVGVTGTSVTNAQGQAGWGYTGTGPVGTDQIQASFVDAVGDTVYSNIVICEWFVENQPPACDAGGPYSGWVNAGFPLDASGCSDPDNDIVTYEWDLDNDGLFDDAAGLSPNVVFNSPGEHPIGLRVTDSARHEVTCWTLAQIGNHPPVAVPGGPYQGPPGATVQLDGSASHDPDVADPISAFAWDLDGDGQFDDSNAVQPTFQIGGATPGTVFQVCLRVTDSFGATGTACTTVTVADRPPTADPGGPYVAECAGGTTSISLSGDGTDPDPGDYIAGYTWTTNCPGAVFTPGPDVRDPVLVVSTPGTCATSCTVALVVTDRFGTASPATSANVTISDHTAPVFDSFPADQTVECGQPVEPPATGAPTAHDVCGSATITSSDSVVPYCGQTRVITRNWTVADVCGNQRSQAQTITVVDQTAPSFASFPPDVVLECGQSTLPAATGSPTASDACGGVTVTHTDATEPGCGLTMVITRTWRIEDACGNPATRDQLITVLDRTPPDFATFPADVTVECTEPTDPGATGSPAVIDVCGTPSLTHSDAVLPGCGQTAVITRTWRAEDQCGNADQRDQTITVRDTAAPAFTVAPGDVTFGCEEGFEEQLQAWLASAEAEDACGSATVVNDFPGLPPGLGTMLVTWTATDECGRSATHSATLRVEDQTPPMLQCPPDGFFDNGSLACSQGLQEWLQSATAEDACDANAPTIAVDAPSCGFPPGTTVVTWTATDSFGNSTSCTSTVTVAGGLAADASWKGSVLVYPNVEVKWNASGQVIQDTFIHLQNDYIDHVDVLVLFVNGDDPLPGNIPPGERPHPGWNHASSQIRVTRNEPVYWSALTGQPKAVFPFALLDSGSPPGRPDPDDPTHQIRTVRGFVVVVAVNGDGHEIRWNHLSGSATIVDYAHGAAWSYTPWTFRAKCVEHGQEPMDCTLRDANGACCQSEVIPGNIDFDGFQYDSGPEYVLAEFYAAGPAMFPIGGLTAAHDLDLSLCLLDQDLRAEATGPSVTSVEVLVWNENEVSFSEPMWCIYCWDQSLASTRGGRFLRANLQTETGMVRFKGLAEGSCTGSHETSLVAVGADLLDRAGQRALAGRPLRGAGRRSASLRFDTFGAVGSVTGGVVPGGGRLPESSSPPQPAINVVLPRR